MEILKRARLAFGYSETPINFQIDSFDQAIKLEADFLSYVRKYKQVLPWTTEAGGQLFGEVRDNEVKVLCATGPL